MRTTDPLQSAMEFPKKAPRRDSGELNEYPMIQANKRRMLTMLRECSCNQCFFRDFVWSYECSSYELISHKVHQGHKGDLGFLTTL